jgi:hypothetical protein
MSNLVFIEWFYYNIVLTHKLSYMKRIAVENFLFFNQKNVFHPMTLQHWD